MYAIIKNGIVINVVVWDGNTETWQPPEGATAVVVPDGQIAYIGFEYENGVFAQPPITTN